MWIRAIASKPKKVKGRKSGMLNESSRRNPEGNNKHHRAFFKANRTAPRTDKMPLAHRHHQHRLMWEQLWGGQLGSNRGFWEGQGKLAAAVFGITQWPSLARHVWGGVWTIGWGQAVKTVRHGQFIAIDAKTLRWRYLLSNAPSFLPDVYAKISFEMDLR